MRKTAKTILRAAGSADAAEHKKEEPGAVLKQKTADRVATGDIVNSTRLRAPTLATAPPLKVVVRGDAVPGQTSMLGPGAAVSRTFVGME